jgi:TPR repeat protein
MAEAMRYYRLAADQGLAAAQVNLGCCHRRGEGAAGKAEAVRCFRLAAEQRHAGGQYNLGYCYERGEGVAQDWAEAVRYYRLAAEQGEPYAQFRLGDCFMRGEGVAQEFAEGVRYYRLATAQPSAFASEELASMLDACDLIARSREVASACCMGCGARRKLKTCAKCHVARFCSTACVARAWPGHKPNCIRTDSILRTPYSDRPSARARCRLVRDDGRERAQRAVEVACSTARRSRRCTSWPASTAGV